MNGRQPFPDLEVRAFDRGDEPAVIDAFRGLSHQSFYRRFFTLTPDAASLVQPFLGRVDHQDHEVLLVFDGPTVVAVAQWDRSTGSPDDAEIALAVADAWQHRGLGRALARMLAGDAHRHGVNRILANVLSENNAALGLAAWNHPAEVALDGPETSFTFPIAS